MAFSSVCFGEQMSIILLSDCLVLILFKIFRESYQGKGLS